MEPPSKKLVSVINRTSRRMPASGIARTVCTVLEEHGHDRSVCVVLESNEAIQNLNREFRHLDEATDVLTFPAPDLPHMPLGDIAISLDYAEDQAQTRGISLEHEVCYLAMHGALHLVGFDDENELDRERMFSEMHRLGLVLGLPEEPHWSSLLHGGSA